MKKATRAVLKEFCTGLPFDILATGLVYWLTRSWSLVIITAILLLAGGACVAHREHIDWRGKVESKD
jgi:hypothetical protein